MARCPRVAFQDVLTKSLPRPLIFIKSFELNLGENRSLHDVVSRAVSYRDAVFGMIRPQRVENKCTQTITAAVSPRERFLKKADRKFLQEGVRRLRATSRRRGGRKDIRRSYDVRVKGFYI